jgi:hypothetical protein
MGKNQLSRDQKRKAKLKRREERSRTHEDLAYSGNKYKTRALTPIIYRTEIGIYESYVMSKRELTDDDVRSALEHMVTLMRRGPLPTPVETDTVHITDGGEEELIIGNIRRNWRIVEEQGMLPGRDDLIGILRTILNSVSIWSSQSMHSRGYLHYLEGFLKKTGVSVRLTDEDLVPLPEPEGDPLLATGRAWVSGGDDVARGRFAREVEALLREGKADRVIEVCQELLGETDDDSDIAILGAFAVRGHRALKAEPG